MEASFEITRSQGNYNFRHVRRSEVFTNFSLNSFLVIVTSVHDFTTNSSFLLQIR